MNPESILNQFTLVEASITRAKLPFETNMLQPKIIEVTLWELIKAREQITNMIREIAPNRFGPHESVSIQWPEITADRLFLCRFCGDPECESDHK